MLRFQAQRVQGKAVRRGIDFAQGLPFAERLPHRSDHDADRERCPGDQDCHHCHYRLLYSICTAACHAAGPAPSLWIDVMRRCAWWRGMKPFRLQIWYSTCFKMALDPVAAVAI